MVAVCEIKKVTACEDNFWECDIHFVIKSNVIHTHFNEMKKNICFGVNFDNAQLCAASFCFGYYLGKRRPPQGYVEINDCIFRFKKWMQ